jgi:hypothetical protein
MSIAPIPGRFDHGNFISDAGYTLTQDQYKEGTTAWFRHLFLRNTVWVAVKDGMNRHILYVSLKIVQLYVAPGQFTPHHGIGAIFARTLKIETHELRQQSESQETQQRKDRLLQAVALNPDTDIRGEFEHDGQIQEAVADGRVRRAMVLLGSGDPENGREAVRLFRLAADQGHARAQLLLGTMYESGRGVPRDLTEATRLYQLAAAQGHLGARIFLSQPPHATDRS